MNCLLKHLRTISIGEVLSGRCAATLRLRWKKENMELLDPIQLCRLARAVVSQSAARDAVALFLRFGAESVTTTRSSAVYGSGVHQLWQ